MLCGIWCLFVFCVIFFFFKQKTAYEMRISDWSSDVCSSDLLNIVLSNDDGFEAANIRALYTELKAAGHDVVLSGPAQNNSGKGGALDFLVPMKRSEEHTSELQSLMRISYAVPCLKKKSGNRRYHFARQEKHKNKPQQINATSHAVSIYTTNIK